MGFNIKLLAIQDKALLDKLLNALIWKKALNMQSKLLKISKNIYFRDQLKLKYLKNLTIMMIGAILKNSI